MKAQDSAKSKEKESKMGLIFGILQIKLQMKNLLALFILFSVVSAGACDALADRPWERGMCEGAPFIFLVIAIAGIALGIGLIFSNIQENAELKAQIHDYFVQYLIGIGLLLASYAIISVSNEIITAIGQGGNPTSTEPLALTLNYFETLLTGDKLTCEATGAQVQFKGAIPIFYELSEKSYAYQIEATAFRYIDFGIPFFYGGSGEAYKADRKAIARSLDLAVDLMIAGVMSLEAQYSFALYVNELFAFIFPIALAFRIFPPSRLIGDFMFACIFAIFILFPLLNILYMKATACMDYNALRSGLPSEMLSDPSMPYEEIAKLIPQMAFLPTLTLILLTTFVMVCMKALSKI